MQASGTQTTKTVDEAIAWAKSKVGSKVDSGQCVAYVKAYYAYLGMDTSKVWGNGKDYATNHCFGWERVKGGQPQRGDILVYSSSSNGYGHVAIYDSDSSIYEQNYNNCLKVEHHTWKYNSGYEPYYWGYIRPNWKPSGPSYTSIADGVYTVRASKDLSMALDIDNNKISSNSANAQIYSINNQANQQFKFQRNSDGTYRITCVKSGKCLDVSEGEAADKTNVQQYDANDTNAQRWYIEDAGNGYVRLRSKGSNKYLDINGNGTANGTNVQIYTGNGTDAQKFKLVNYGDFGIRTTSLATGYYVMESAIDSTYAVDATNGSVANGTNLQLYACLQNDAQVFHIVKQDSGYYRISPLQSDGVAFDVYGCEFNDGTNVRLYTANGTNAQNWIVRLCDDGSYAFQCVGTGKFLDAYGGKAANGTNMNQWVGNGTAAQKFRLVPWSKDVSSARVEVSGVGASYAYTGSSIKPSPNARWLANSLDGLRVPESGNATGGYSNRRILDVKANHTYVIEIDKAERLAGSAANGQIRAVGSDGLDYATRGTVKWSNSRQSITITPTKDCSLYIYPAVAADTKGCAAKFTGVRVYEQMASGSDYEVSYRDNVNAGKATVTVSGKGSYSGSKALAFTITESFASGSSASTVSGDGGSGGNASWQARLADGSGSLLMHRLYNQWSGEHFYTADDTEFAGLVELGWTDEGEGWKAPASSSTPVFRLYNPYAGEHHYTMDAAERDSMVDAGWIYEDIGWYSDDAQTMPLYREYNPNAFANNHNYTTNEEEHSFLVSIGWVDEGYAWYGV